MNISTSNPKYKQFIKLTTQPKARRRDGMTILHGVHLTVAYLDRGMVPEALVYSEGLEVNTEVAAILSRCEALGVELLCFPKGTQKVVSGVDNGVPLAFVIRIPDVESPDSIQEGSLLLDTVQDPTNIGALIRTAAAAGVSAVYLSSGCASAWSPKALRAGMGGQFAVDIYENCDLVHLIQHSPVPVLATTLGASKTIYEAEIPKAAAWLFGNEGAGVSSNLLEAGVDEVTIPQADGVESLNVAAAAAVCLFEQRRSIVI